MLDGASFLQRVRYITLPMLRPTIAMIFILRLGSILASDFGLFYQVPMNSNSLQTVTQTLDVYVYKALMLQANFNYSAAASFLQNLVGCALLLLAAAAAVGLYYYVFSIPEPNGLSLASWPNRFTDNFPGWIEAEGNTVRVADIGLERLDEYGLCLQILDASGREAFSYRKPASWPEAYSAAELAALAEQPYEDGRSVFVSSTDAGAQTWTCLVGFPYPIGKRMIYYNGRTVGRLLPVFAAAAALILGIAAAALFLYGLWLTRRTAAITRGIEAASRREYQALPERGLFSDVNAALNQMDARLRHSEQLRAQTYAMVDKFE